MNVVAAAELAPRTYADDEALLGGILDEVICAVEGPEALDLHRAAIDLGERSRSGDAAAAEQLAELIAGLRARRRSCCSSACSRAGFSS